MFLLKAGEDNNYFFEENNNRKFYINRGLEKGLTTWRTLVGNEVIIKYPKYWTPLNWNNTIRHLSKVENDKKVIFNELK